MLQTLLGKLMTLPQIPLFGWRWDTLLISFPHSVLRSLRLDSLAFGALHSI